MNPTERFYFDARTQEILEHLTIPFAIYQYIDKRVVTVALSQGFCTEFGFKTLRDAYQAMDNDMYRATHPDDKSRVADAAYRFAAFDVPYDMVYRTRTLKDPDYIILHAYGKSIYPKPGVRLCLTWYAYEGHFSEEQGIYENILSHTLSRFLAEDRESRGMYYDYMTGLPNMTYFYELAEAGRRSIQEGGQASTICFFDLTGLKRFNRRHGYAEGDRLIRAVAAILARNFSSENCARFAQDHFAAFAPEDGLRARLDAVIEECAAANDGKTLPLRIGVYPDRIEAVEIGTACDRARLAANSRRKSEGSCVAVFDQLMLAEEKNRQEIVDNLDRAIEEGWIKVYYQPIVRSVNGKICDVEALARWDDPVRGLLSPASFIPVLEETGLIYKLDLCVVRQVLRDLKATEKSGIQCLPVSINFSRVDFDACDLVHELCRMVDEAGVDRRLIHVEITESVVGSDFDYMKEQIEHFRSHGFQVWMDDFGSGYSSLDVLQRIKFDLIKFDMGFTRRLDEGNSGKIILTEMMRMATSLGVDTVCEGVETETQAAFLREIGCSKLQGYYYSKPDLPHDILKRYTRDIQNSFEDPGESAYYDAVGRVNLYDLSFLASLDDSVTKNTFDTVPMGVMEVNRNGDRVKCVRSNPSYRDFMKRAFGFDLSDPNREYPVPAEGPAANFMKAVEQSRNNGSNRAFVAETLADGSAAHSFARVVGESPVTGSYSVAIAVLSVTEPDESTTYADIARALAADYYNIYVIDLDTDEYTEYSSQVGGEELQKERKDVDFFASARRETMTRIYEDDREGFLKLFTRENVLRELDAQGVFTTSYRLIDTGTPMYVNMKITRMRGGNRIILGVSIIDSQMKQQEEEKRLRQEKAALGRIAALSPDYIVLYTVDPVTGQYTQYSPSNEFESFGLDRQGEDFFTDVRLDAPKAIAPEDMERHLRVLTKENMLREMRENGFFIHRYGLLLDGKAVPVVLRATLAREEDREMIVLGVSMDRAEEPQDTEAETRRELSVLLQENEQLKKEAAVSRRIAELKDSVSSLLTNMPGLTFSKDVATGRYLACNQAFAVYAGKDTPEGVVGLTDYEIFDRETAEHFVADDKKALGMDEPYVFFEDVLDAKGQQKQFQTTKLKFIDNAGKECLLGLCQDMTEAVRYQRENASTKEAYEAARSTSIIYSHIARALARGYTDLYYVNIETDELIEYHTDDELGVLTEARRGTDFFEGCRRDVKLFVHPDDQEEFVRAMDREFLTAELERSKVFEMTYRRIKNEKTFYVQMKVSRVEGDRRFIVLAVSDVDELMKKRQAEERIQEEQIIYARLHALTGNFLVVYVVDPETDSYREFSSTDNYTESLQQAKDGENFFEKVRKVAHEANYPADLKRFLSAFTKENVMAEIARSGIFTFGYRIMMDGRPVHVQMKAALVEEKEGARLIVGLNDVDAQIRQEEEIEKRLEQAQAQANIDAVTGVKNKHAFLETETRIDRQIENNRQAPFAVVMFDVNDLKKINDSLGHQAGDQAIRDACKTICDTFKHSPVFRVGGDEFAVIAQGQDYTHIHELVTEINRRNEAALRSGGLVIACGMARFEQETCVAAVFERADHRMYENKNALKSAKRESAPERDG